MAHNHAGVDATTAASGAEHQKRLMMSLGLTSTVFIAEVVSAIVTGSLAPPVDARRVCPTPATCSPTCRC